MKKNIKNKMLFSTPFLDHFYKTKIISLDDYQAMVETIKMAHIAYRSQGLQTKVSTNSILKLKGRSNDNYSSRNAEVLWRWISSNLNKSFRGVSMHKVLHWLMVSEGNINDYSDQVVKQTINYIKNLWERVLRYFENTDQIISQDYC